MTKPKTLDQLRAEKERAETQLAQEKHKLERLENRKKYLEKGERTKRTHRLCNLGGTIESLAPEVKDLTRTEMTANPYPARLRFKPDNNLIFIFYLYGGSFLILLVIIRILLRNLPGDFEDFWIFFLRVERDYLFDGDVMLPLVAEIEEIIRSRAGEKVMPDIAFA